MLCEFAVKHCNQGLTFSRCLDTGFAHDIGCGQRLAVQAVVRVIVWFHCCASQGYPSEQSLGLPVGQNLGVRCTGRCGAGCRMLTFFKRAGFDLLLSEAADLFPLRLLE